MDATTESVATQVACPLSLEQQVDLMRLFHGVAYEARHTLSRALHRQDMTEAEFLLLWTCFRRAAKPVGQQRLVFDVGLSKAQTSGLLESLRRKQYLSGERSVDDRRRQLWQITSLGRQQVEEVLRHLDGNTGDWLAGLHPDVYRLLVQGLTDALAQASKPESSLDLPRREAA